MCAIFGLRGNAIRRIRTLLQSPVRHSHRHRPGGLDAQHKQTDHRYQHAGDQDEYQCRHSSALPHRSLQSGLVKKQNRRSLNNLTEQPTLSHFARQTFAFATPFTFIEPRPSGTDSRQSQIGEHSAPVGEKKLLACTLLKCDARGRLLVLKRKHAKDRWTILTLFRSDAACHAESIRQRAMGVGRRIYSGVVMKLFFNYRREDTDDLAGRLHDRLSVEFGAENIFKDVDSIRPGQNWRVVLEQSVSGCDVVLAIVGRNWLTVSDESGQRRIEADEDFVRFELEAARRAGKIVMPVVVKGASIPNAGQLPESIRWLFDFHKAELRPDPFFKDDVARLLAELIRIRDRLKEQPKQIVSPVGNSRAVAPDGGGVIRCGSCHSQCERTDQFCQVCGAGLWTSCPTCDLPVPQNQVFCGGCGSNLPKVRELIELTVRNEKRFSQAVAIRAVSERLTALDLLTREIEGTVRVYPRHQPLERLQLQCMEMYRRSARELADSVFESGQLESAREHYIALRQVDPVAADHANARLAEIDDAHRTGRLKSRELAGKGDFKAAAEGLRRLCGSFPSDEQLQSELQHFEAVVARVSRLIPDGLRELKRQHHFLALEQELLWLRQEKIPVRNLESWIEEVKGLIRKANAEYQEAQSELREGRFRQARRLANGILKSVADHTGARELLAATSGADEMIAQLQTLIQRGQFCSANRLVRSLDDQSISDPRLTKLTARIKVEIASLDASIRLILVMFCVTCIPGYLIGDKVYHLVRLGDSTESGLTRGLIWLATMVVVPMFVATMIFVATPNRGERLARFLFDWLPFGKSLPRVRPVEESDSALFDATEAAANPNPVRGPRKPDPHAIDIRFSEVKPVTSGADTIDRASQTIVTPTGAGTPQLSGHAVAKSDPLLFQTVDLDRSARLIELLTIGVLTFCLSVAGGRAAWAWLLLKRFDPELTTDARTMEILGPLATLVPLLALVIFSVAIEPSARWRRLAWAGGIAIGFEFVAAILYADSLPVVRSLVQFSILLLAIAEIQRITFRHCLALQFGGLIGASLMLSAVAVPLLAVAIAVDFSEHAIPADSFIQLILATFLICQVYVFIASTGSIQISRLAADYPILRGTLSIGAAWVMAAVLSMTSGWLTEKLKEDWQTVGRWVVLLLLIQILPLTLTGRRALSWARQWLMLSGLMVLLAGLLWWCTPGSAKLLFPATFAFGVVGQLRLETTSLFDEGQRLLVQLKLRHSRRMFLLNQKLRRG